MKSEFVRTVDGLEIHTLSSDSWDDQTPLIFVPGMMGIADFYEREMTEFSPRRILALSHRGCGKSEIPPIGKADFRSRVNDIAAVASGFALHNYFLCGFSRGVSLAVQHAIDYPGAVRGLFSDSVTNFMAET